jgi:hypothetical protein
MNKKVSELLRQTKIEVASEIFFLVALKNEDWLKLLENPELSPRMSAPFMIFKDRFEITLLLDEIDFGTIRHAVREGKTESGFRLLTFDIELDFSIVGFMAEISRILAEAKISLIPVSAFSRDHLLIKQSDLSNALKALRGFVADIC